MQPFAARIIVAALGFLAGAGLPAPGRAGEAKRATPRSAGSYAVVVSKTAGEDAGWQKVVEALVRKHQAAVILYDGDVRKALGPLKERFPHYACFVARPEEAGRDFVAQVNRLTRQLDDDPYTDVIWGILTGYDAANALQIAQQDQPLCITRVAAGTEIALEMCDEGVWYSELAKGKLVRKKPGGRPAAETGPADTTRALVDALNDYRAELLVTSGHATERDWQIGFRYRNGSFQSKAGQLFGVDTQGRRWPVHAPGPKVYLPVGNCLMGHIDGPDAMALAFLNSAGVRQMIGYTVPTWYGYGGWGCLDYFLEQPGRFTLAEAFFANQQALLHQLETEFPKEARKDLPPGSGTANGLLYDRDVVAFYGDPAWEARMRPGALAWAQTLTEQDGVYTFVVTPQRGERTFLPVNTNGSQRGGRPIFTFLPYRVKDIEIVEGADLHPLVTDNFLLVPLPRYERGRTYKVVFKAGPVR